MPHSNRAAILHALEDAVGSAEPADQLNLAVEWIEFYWQKCSAGAIRETPPHLTRIVKRQPPDPVLIPGEQ